MFVPVIFISYGSDSMLEINFRVTWLFYIYYKI